MSSVVGDDALIGLALLLPATGALAVLLLGRIPNARDAASFVATLLTFGAVTQLVPRVMAGERPSLHFAEVLPGVELAFRVEPLGMLYALVASGLWIPTALYAVGYMRAHHEPNQTRFFVFFALAISAALGIAFAQNLFTLFLFYELLTFSTFPLVTHHGDAAAKRAGRIYLGILVSSSIALLLLAIVWTYRVAGTLELRPGGILSGKVDGAELTVLLALYVFGCGKAALMPLHRWLPAAMVAPTPVSALLHAVAVVKAGVFSVLKIVLYVFGADTLTASDSGQWLSYAAAFTLVSASVVALTKDNLKARLAYSTISQLAYIVLGATLATPAALLGAGMHIATHAAGKITLFFCAGAVYVATHKTEISAMDGIGRRMPFTMGAFALGSLSIIGLPPFGGSFSKWQLALGAAQGDELVLLGVLMLSSLLSVLYLMPIVVRAFFHAEGPRVHAAGHDAEHSPNEHGIAEAPLLCVIPLCAAALSCIALFFGASALEALLLPLVELHP